MTDSHSPSARQIDAAVAEAFGRTLEPDPSELAADVSRLRAAGLSSALAESAARGLHRGTYSSLREAAAVTSAFHGDGRSVDLDALQEQAGVQVTQVTRVDGKTVSKVVDLSGGL